MSIVCCNCGKKMDNYYAVKYTIEYLEEYLSVYFEIGVDQIKKKYIQNKKFVKFRSICFNVLYKYSSLTLKQIAHRYGKSIETVREAMKYVKETDHDYKFILKDLAGELPEVIIDKQFSL